jgi:hypothetical protein
MMVESFIFGFGAFGEDGKLFPVQAIGKESSGLQPKI